MMNRLDLITRPLRTARPKGQMLVIFALFMSLVFIGVAALAIDFGTWLLTQRTLQNAADGAALAGAAEYAPGVGLNASQTRAAIAAVDYVDANLNLGMSASDKTIAAGTANSVNGYCYPNNACATAAYQFWVYTPTPSTSASATTGLPGGPRTIYLSPQKYASRSKLVFVRVDRARSSFFAQYLGNGGPVIATQAVAGPRRNQYAVEALKPQFSNSDNRIGVTLNGASVTIPRGDVGSNYSIDWASNNSCVYFTGGGEQEIDLMNVGAQQGVNNQCFTGGTLQPLDDLIQDPRYTFPLPGSPAMHAPPAGAYPACALTSGVPTRVGVIDCGNSLPTGTVIYPGIYQYVNIPPGVNVTLSRACYSGEGCQLGTFWFKDTGVNSQNKYGLSVGGNSGNPSTLAGQGVLLIFDPNEHDPITFTVGGPGSNLKLNDSPCMITEASLPDACVSGIPYVWYNPDDNDPDPHANPVSVWVRPNYVTVGSGSAVSYYGIASSDYPHDGSNVIKLQAGSAVSEYGMIYGPEDNVIVAGGPAGTGVGQVIAWTITYSGSNSSLTETYPGQSRARPRLLQ